MAEHVSISSQIARLEKLGFLGESGVSADSFHKQFDAESADTGSDELVKVLVVSPARIALPKQFELAGIKSLDLALDKMKDYYAPPEETYVATIRIDDERMAIKADPQREAREFRAGERGATLAEAIHLYVQYPQLLNRHVFDCHGTLYGGEEGHLPIIYLWNGKPEAGEACPGVFCQAATVGGPALRVLAPVPTQTGSEA